MKSLSDSLKSQLKSIADPRFTRQVKRSLPGLTPSLMRFASYWPHNQDASAYSRSLAARPEGAASLPVPPRELWADYGQTAETYLASGREDSDAMRRIVAASGAPIEDANRILDLGCAACRMTRWLSDLTPQIQIWGCDIWADAIMWCQDNITPPFWFATTTASPHLPFEDRSFGLVYCGSLFTQIDDLTETWFLELHRILRPGGRLYFSLNDRLSVGIFDGNADPAAYDRYYERVGRQLWATWVEQISAEPDYQRFRNGDAYMVAFNRHWRVNVMWDADILCKRVGYGYRVCSVNPASYGHQTTVLLERI